MSRAVKSTLKALETAAKNKGDKAIASTVEELKAISQNLKLDDASARQNGPRLMIVLDEKFEAVYKLLPVESKDFATSFLLYILPTLKSESPNISWQMVASRGILPVLVNCMQAAENEAIHFGKPFVTSLCQLLTGTSDQKLNIDMRQSIGKFLIELLTKQQDAKKWLLEPKLIGVQGLGKLIVGCTDFRVLDTYLEISARLTPKRSDPQARKAFLMDVFYNASAKGIFGEAKCKKIMDIMDQPRKGSWFEISDPVFAEIGSNMKRPQRFVINKLVVCGHYIFPNGELRLFIDSEITLSGFSDEGDEEMLNSTFDNIISIKLENISLSKLLLVFQLRNAPTWQNPLELSSEHGKNPTISFEMLNNERDHILGTFKTRKQENKVILSTDSVKQSMSQKATLLQAPTLPLSPERKSQVVINSYGMSLVLIDSQADLPLASASETSNPVEPSQLRSPPASINKKQPTLIDLLSSSGDSSPEKPLATAKAPSISSDTDIESPISVNKQANAASRSVESQRANVTVDSDDDDNFSTIKAPRSVKRKLLETPEHEDSPVKKRPRVSPREIVHVMNEVHNKPSDNRARDLPAATKLVDKTNILVQPRTSRGPGSAPPTRNHDQGKEISLPISHKDTIKPVSTTTNAVGAPDGKPRSIKQAQKAIWEMDDFAEKAEALLSSELDITKPQYEPSVSWASPLNPTHDDITTQAATLLPSANIKEKGKSQEKVITFKVDPAEQDELSSPIRPAMVKRSRDRAAKALQSIKGAGQENIASKPKDAELNDFGRVKTDPKLQSQGSIIKKAGPSPMTRVRPYKNKPPPGTQLGLHPEKTRWDNRNKWKITADYSDSDDSSYHVKEPKTLEDDIADILDTIQKTVFDNITRKFTAVRDETRLTRMQLLDEAATDLETMGDDFGRFRTQFVGLDASFGDITHAIAGAVTDLHAVNSNVTQALSKIIKKHDHVMASSSAQAVPFVAPLPSVLSISN